MGKRANHPLDALHGIAVSSTNCHVPVVSRNRLAEEPGGGVSRVRNYAARLPHSGLLRVLQIIDQDIGLAGPARQEEPEFVREAQVARRDVHQGDAGSLFAGSAVGVRGTGRCFAVGESRGHVQGARAADTGTETTYPFRRHRVGELSVVHARALQAQVLVSYNFHRTVDQTRQLAAVVVEGAAQIKRLDHRTNALGDDVGSDMRKHGEILVA